MKKCPADSATPRPAIDQSFFISDVSALFVLTLELSFSFATCLSAACCALFLEYVFEWIWVSFLCHFLYTFGVMLGSYWGHFRGHVGVILGSFWGHVGVSEGVPLKLSKNLRLGLHLGAQLGPKLAPKLGQVELKIDV